MAIESNSKFKVFYCQSYLPESGLNVGGLYVFQGGIYLADSATTTIKLDGIRTGNNTAMLAAEGIQGQYWFNTSDSILYWWDTSANDNAGGWAAFSANQAKNLSQAVSINVKDNATTPNTLGSGTLAAGTNSVDLTISSIPTALLSGALKADTTLASDPDARDDSTKIPSTGWVQDEIAYALGQAAVKVMHYKGTVSATSGLPDASTAALTPTVGDVYNVSADGSNWAFTDETISTPGGASGTDYIAVNDSNSQLIGYWEKLGSTLDTTYFAKTNVSNTFTEGNTFSSTVGVSGALTASGGATVTSGLSTDTLAVSSTSTFSGDVTLSGATTDLAVGGNISGSGTLDVAGATTIGTSTTASSFKVYGPAEATGNTTIGGTLGVTGKTTVTTVEATGAVDFDSTLNVDGLATFGAGATISSGDLTVSTGDVTVTTGGVTITAGDLSVGDALSVGGLSTFANNVTVGGTGTGEGANLTVNGNAAVTGTFDVDGAADFDGTVDMTGSSAVSLGANATATTKAAGSGLSNDTATKTAVATVEYVDAAVTAGLTWNVIGAVEP